MAKKQETEETKDLAESGSAPLATIGKLEYALLKADAADMIEVIKDNMGPGGLKAFDLTRVKVPSGGGTTWQMPTLQGMKNIEEIEGVVIYWCDVRAYWSQSFTGAGTPPDCTSEDCERGFGEPGGDCVECPFSKFGTATNAKGENARGQACKQIRRMFILTPTSLLPILVAAPPTSIRKVAEYFRLLAGSGLRYWQISTRLKLIPDKNADGIKYSAILPEPGTQLTPEQAAVIKKIAESITPRISVVPITAEDYPVDEAPRADERAPAGEAALTGE